MAQLDSQLRTRIQQLSPAERAELASVLIASLDDEESEGAPTLADDWAAELSCRLARLDRGEANLIPEAEVFCKARRLAP